MGVEKSCLTFVCDYAQIDGSLQSKKRLKFILNDGTFVTVPVKASDVKVQETIRKLKTEEKIVILEVKDDSNPLVFSRFFPTRCIKKASGRIESFEDGIGTIKGTLSETKEPVSVLFSARNLDKETMRAGCDLITRHAEVNFGIVSTTRENHRENYAVWVKPTVQASTQPEPPAENEPETTYAGVLFNVARESASIYCKELGVVDFSVDVVQPTVRSLKINHTEGKWVEFQAPFHPSNNIRIVSRVQLYANAAGKPSRPLEYDRYGEGEFEIKDILCMVCSVGQFYGLLWSDVLGKVFFNRQEQEDFAEHLKPSVWTRCSVKVAGYQETRPTYSNCWLEATSFHFEDIAPPDTPEIFQATGILEGKNEVTCVLQCAERGQIMADMTVFEDSGSFPAVGAKFHVLVAPSTFHELSDWEALGVCGTQSEEPLLSSSSNTLEATEPVPAASSDETSTDPVPDRKSPLAIPRPLSSSSLPPTVTSKALTKPVRKLWTPALGIETHLYLETILPSLVAVQNPDFSEQSGPRSRSYVSSLPKATRPASVLENRISSPQASPAHSVQTDSRSSLPITSRQKPSSLPFGFRVSPKKSTVSDPSAEPQERETLPSLARTMNSYSEKRQPGEIKKPLGDRKSSAEVTVVPGSTRISPSTSSQVYDYGFDSEEEVVEDPRMGKNPAVATADNECQTQQTVEAKICTEIIHDQELFGFFVAKFPELLPKLLKLKLF